MRSHGEIVINWKDHLLIIYGQGPFNEEGIIESINEIKNTVCSKNIKNWARLEIWDENTLGSPFVVRCVKEYFTWCVEHGCQAGAVVVSTNIQREIIAKDFLGNIEIFKSKNKAMDWLIKDNYI